MQNKSVNHSPDQTLRRSGAEQRSSGAANSGAAAAADQDAPLAGVKVSGWVGLLRGVPPSNAQGDEG